jgi:acyl-CoA reductase-like NAD-dependent aldehyde dehydrogenase
MIISTNPATEAEIQRFNPHTADQVRAILAAADAAQKD